MTTRLVFLLCLAAPTLAFGDIPPPPGYVESCTIDKQCKAEEEGITCSANHTDPEACDKLRAKEGYARRCKTRGASVWTEIWCRPRSKPKTNPDKKK